METASVVHRDVHLGRLRPFLEALLGALGEAGIGGSRLGEVLEGRVWAECLQCGMRLKAVELVAALAVDGAGDANPKLARLRQHYCARADCPSYFYRFFFQPEPGIDWARLLARAASLGDERGAVLEAEAEQSRERRARDRMRRVGRLAAGIVAVVLLWVAHHWWRTGSLPGVAPVSKYRVDPQSLPPNPNQPTREVR